VFVILPSTRITVTLEDLHSDKEEGVPALLNPLKDDTLLSPVAQRLVDTIHCMRLHVSVNLSRSILLTGPPGVGKTHAVRVAFQYGQQRGPTRLWSVRGSELLANNEANDTNASRALQRNFREALQYASQSELHVALIFLDECDALVSSNMTDENDTTTAAATATLAWLLDQLNDSGAGNKSGWQRVLMVAATNRLDAIPQFLRRPGRLDREMVLSPPSATERLALLRQLLTGPTAGDSAEHLMGPNEQELLSVADACVGYVPADLVALVRRATFLSLQEGGEGGDGRVTPSHLYRAMADVGASALRDAALSAPPKMGWDDVAGDPGGAKVRVLDFWKLVTRWPFHI
jgi:transitional endoplasmic reticulum ATPase